MSDLNEPGFKSGDTLAALGAFFDSLKENEKKAQIKKTNGIFQLNVKNAQGKEAAWIIDLKNEGKVSRDTKKKADVTLNLSDDTFSQLADGKLNGQKAFMTGALKVKGNVMLATKLDSVLKSAKSKL